MKNYKDILVILATIAIIDSVNAQTINWASMKEENKHIINASLGLEYGVIYGLGYGYHLNTRLFNIVPNVEYSFPSGNRIFDDFKTKIGVQISWVEVHNFHFITKIDGVFRRYENDMVRLINFGSDMSGIVGYYRHNWFVASEFGFDKAIVTNFKHSILYKDQFPGAVDGWYQPATGGNFYYGLQTGCSFKHNDIYLKVGKTITQDFKTKPMIPVYAQLGYNFRFN
jgi:hypothetical protein